MPNNKLSFNLVNLNNELVMKSLNTTKMELNTIKGLGTICKYFNIYDPVKEVFTVDPISVFDALDDYIVGCRNYENSFVLYSLSSNDMRFAISFHNPNSSGEAMTKTHSVGRQPRCGASRELGLA